MIFPKWVQAKFRESNHIKTGAFARCGALDFMFCLEFQILLTKSLCSYVIVELIYLEFI